MPEMIGPSYFYIHCAKTAGIAVSQVLKDQFRGRQCNLRSLPKAVATNSLIFTGVRNPYDRCLSLWWSMCSPGDYYHVVAEGKTEPVEFLRYITSGEYGKRHPTRTAGHLDKTCSEHIGNVSLGAVLHFETLLEDFNALPFVKTPLQSIPLGNRKSNGRPERWPLEIPEFRQIVEEWAKKDFERFGYEIGKIPEEAN